MLRTKQGSALILTLTATALISVSVLSHWYQASLVYEVVVTRERYYKNVACAQGAMDFVIAEWLKGGRKTRAGWSGIIDKRAKLKVEASIRPFKKRSRKKLVSVKLIENSKTCCSLSCMLIPQMKNGEKIYVRRYYTLGAAV